MGTLIIGLGEKKPKGKNLFDEEHDEGDKGEGSYDEESKETKGEEDSEESVAADELADILGVADDKRSDFKSALESYVSLCVDKSMK